MFKNRKGFTLIELLAVIVVIALIALITVPILLNVIDKSKKGALQDSAYGIIEAGELYYAKNMMNLENDVARYDFEVQSGKFVNKLDISKELPFKGTMPKTGTLQINSNGKTAVAICTNSYCACKSISELKVTIKDTNCNIDPVTGEIENTIVDSSSMTPSGTIISFAGSTAPEGYIICDGRQVSRTEYSKLYSAIGNTYGAGDGSTTFNVPDLRGEFLRGTGTATRNTGSGSSIGTHQDGTIFPSLYQWGNTFGIMTSTNKTNDYNARTTIQDKIVNAERYYTSVTASFNSQVVEYQGDYTSRPTNTSVLYCIKY